MKINLIKGVKKRESCFFYRRDTINGVYRTEVCEKCSFKSPPITRCVECTLYAPYLSMTELAERELERHKQMKQTIENDQLTTKVEIPNMAEKKIKSGIAKYKQKSTQLKCSPLMSFIEKDNHIKKTETQMKLGHNIQKNVRYL
jgi:hypothetical protein